tara:strand:- start:9603 stop:10736 length:1134 start_codon:yes stop_codon:yes gene_type:complete
MNWIKDFTLGLISIFISYSLLIAGDWYIQKNIIQQLKHNSEYSEAKKIEELRSKNEDLPQKELAVNDGYLPIIVPSQMDLLDKNYPLVAGLPNSKTYYCNEGYGLIRYSSDRFGFRNKDESWDKKNPIIIIGDSFVQGACVASNQTLPAYLEKNTNRAVINLGMSANHPGHYLAYGELFIPKIKPTHVYLVFYTNDNAAVEKSVLEKAYLKGNKKLFSSTELRLFDAKFFKDEGLKIIDEIKKIDQDPTNKLNKNILRRLISAFLRHASLPEIRSLIWPGSADFKQTKRAIHSTFNLCNTFNCNFTILFIPNSNFYRPDSRADQYGDSIEQLAISLNIKFIDGRDVLDRSRASKDYAIKGPHLSPLGYKKLADLITK